MNALFVANFPSNTGYAWDTIEAVFERLATRLSEAGWRIHVSYSALSGGFPERMRRVPVQVLEFDYLGEYGSVAALMRFVKLLRQHRIEVLYLTDQPTRAWRYILYRLAGVRRIVVHDRTSGARQSRARWLRQLKRLLHLFPGTAADTVIAVSDFVAHRLHHVNGVSRERIRRVHNGIDLTRYENIDRSYLRRTLQLHEDVPVVFAAGRANRYKGIHVLIAALAQLEREGRDIAFVYCGEGPDLAEFKALAQQLGLRRARFTGKRNDVAQLVAGATVAAVPSIWAEAFGLTVVEAMAAGVPVVATRTGGIPELVSPGETGLLVPADNAAELADAIRQLLDDATLRQRIGDAARARAFAYFGIDRTVAELLELFLPGSSAVPRQTAAPPMMAAT